MEGTCQQVRKQMGPARAGVPTLPQLPLERGKDGVVRRCEPYQTCVHALQLCLRHGVEIQTRSGLRRTRPLQPPQEDLGGAGIGDRSLTQTTLDVGVGRGSRVRRGCAARRWSHETRDSRVRGGTRASALTPSH